MLSIKQIPEHIPERAGLSPAEDALLSGIQSRRSRGSNSIDSTSANFSGAGSGIPLACKGKFWGTDPVTGNLVGFNVYSPLFLGLLNPEVLPQDLRLSMNGQLGLHPVAPVRSIYGQYDPVMAYKTWSQNHKEVNDPGRGCYGNNNQGKVLPCTAADRMLPCEEDKERDGKVNKQNVIFVLKDTEANCTLCHHNKIN